MAGPYFDRPDPIFGSNPSLLVRRGPANAPDRHFYHFEIRVRNILVYTLKSVLKNGGRNVKKILRNLGTTFEPTGTISGPISSSEPSIHVSGTPFDRFRGYF